MKQDHKNRIEVLTKEVEKLQLRISEHKKKLLKSKDTSMESAVRDMLVKRIKINLESCKTISSVLTLITSDNVLSSLIEKTDEITMFASLLLAIRHESYEEVITNKDYDLAIDRVLKLL